MMESESKLSETEVVRSSVKTVILASMIGTAVEFFDFYAYGTAAAAYFPKVFFPQMTPLLATVLSLLTFGVAFVARPVGSFLFGHFGDSLGRKKTLVLSMLVMGVSTIAIGFFLCNGLFFVLEKTLSAQQMLVFGWRIPFLVSAVLVVIGLYVRHHLQETPLFQLAQENDTTTKTPLKELFSDYWKDIVKGTFIMGGTYAMFYTLTTWSLAYATTALGFSHSEMLLFLMGAIVEFAVLIMTTSMLADKIGRKKVLLTATVGLVVFSLVFPYFLSGQHNVLGMFLFLGVGFVIMGTLYGPVGAVLPELFPTKVRYSGAGITYNLAAVVGAAVAPSVTTWLIASFGAHAAGLYMFVLAVASVVAWLTTKETKDVDYTK